MNTPRDTLGIALDAREKGIVAIPCLAGTKVPVVGWKRWQTEMPPEELVREWFSVRRNIAILTSGMVVFDCDEREKADLVIEKCAETSPKIRTPRGGIHLGYRRRMGVVLKNSVKIKGMPIDIRTYGGIEVIPQSWTEDGGYEWLGEGLKPVSELPCGNIGWTRERKKKPRPAPISSELPPGEGRIRNPERYCLTIPSIQGSNGSGGLWRVVSILYEARHTPGQVMDYLLHVWNPRCAEPPWSERELQHTVNRRFRLK